MSKSFNFGTSPVFASVPQAIFPFGIVREADMEETSRDSSATTSFLLGTHAVVITLLRHHLTSGIIAAMFALGLIGWFETFLPLR